MYVGDIYIRYVFDTTHLDQRPGEGGWGLGFCVFGKVDEPSMRVAEEISRQPTQESGGMKMLTKPVVFEAVTVSE